MGVRVRGKATARPKKVEDPAFNEERGVVCRGPESLGTRKKRRWRTKPVRDEKNFRQVVSER